MNEETRDMIRACINLMEYCSNRDCRGFDIEMNTPLDRAHCNFEFTLDLNTEGKN